MHASMRGTQGVDLLCDLHGGDLRRDCRTDTPRTDDTNENGAELTPDADGDDGADGALRAVADELVCDLEGQHDARKEEGESDDEEGVRTEMRHLVDDAAHAQALGDLPHGLPVEEGDAADVRKMREDNAPHQLKYALHRFPPLLHLFIEKASPPPRVRVHRSARCARCLHAP